MVERPVLQHELDDVLNLGQPIGLLGLDGRRWRGKGHAHMLTDTSTKINVNGIVSQKTSMSCVTNAANHDGGRHVATCWPR